MVFLRGTKTFQKINAVIKVVNLVSASKPNKLCKNFLQHVILLNKQLTFHGYVLCCMHLLSLPYIRNFCQYLNYVWFVGIFWKH